MPVTMETTNPFRGRRVRWSRSHLWIILWLIALTIPTVQAWRGASSPDRWEYRPPGPLAQLVDVGLLLATVLLGFSLARHRRWATVWAAAILGALVLEIGDQVQVSRGWMAGHSDTDPFFYYLAAVAILLGAGAAAAVVWLAIRGRLTGSRSQR